MQNITTLDQYMTTYGPILSRRAQDELDPLHQPARDPVHPVIAKLKRQPYAPQAHVITGAVAAWSHDKGHMLIGEPGTGKTIMGMAIVHCHANGKPYRAIVLCPNQLVKKWRRELQETIPGARVRIISRCSDLLSLADTHDPLYPEWYIISRDTAKLGPAWKPAVASRSGFLIDVDKESGRQTRVVGKLLCCPQCGGEARARTKLDPKGERLSIEDLGKRKYSCSEPRIDRDTGRQIERDGSPVPCGAQLWTFTRDIKRFEPARYIHEKLKYHFGYAIFDECHELSNASSAQGNAMGTIAASANRVLAMTGTLLNGYCDSVRAVLFRINPDSVLEEGFTWEGSMPFSERYGRIETVIFEKNKGARSVVTDDNKMSRGNKKNITKHLRPGIMPSLFGNHLMGKCTFLGLDEMERQLPEYTEVICPIDMDPALANEYSVIETELRAVVKKMLARKDRRLLGAMLHTLLCYPDHPFSWGPVGYRDVDRFVEVVQPRSLPSDIHYAKERWLLDACGNEYNEGRQAWVYCQHNGRHDVESRLQRLLSKDLHVKVLKREIPPAEREEWIDNNCRDVDVMISHPKLVETGLDLFSKNYLGHNFCTLIHYSCGTILSTLRQASRRAWRIGQMKPCRTLFGYYRGTLQERMINLMSRKLLAAEALEGRFSSEGLVALSGDDGVEMELARSLANNEHITSDRSWQTMPAAQDEPVDQREALVLQ